MAQILLPVLPRFGPDDAQIIQGLMQHIINAGHEAGVMVLTQPGGIPDDTTMEKYHRNLEPVAKNYPDTMPVIVMATNMPPEYVDFLDNTDEAIQNIMHMVDFASGLQFGGQKVISYHIHGFVNAETMRTTTASYWREQVWSETIAPALTEVAQYAASMRVQPVIEICPVPYWWDLSTDDKVVYRGMSRRDLRSPFYMAGNLWGYPELKETGNGVCPDLCHVRTLYAHARADVVDGIFFKEDVDILKEGSVWQNVDELTPKIDHCQVNDGDGLGNDEGGMFREGVALGQGDIEELPDILRAMRDYRIPMVLEVGEVDFKNPTRPNNVKSIEYIIETLAT